MGKPDKSRILQIISNNPIEKEYFFRKLANAENPSEWLLPLKKEKYLEPSNNPKPIESKDQKGQFTIPYWEILDFLLNVAEKNKKNPHEEITEELVNFIDSIISYNKKIEKIDNYRTNWMLIKIIFALPFPSIKKEHVEYISDALNTTWSNNLIIDAITKNVLTVLLKNHPNSHNYLILLMTYVWQYKKINGNVLREEYNSIFPPYQLKRFMDNYRIYIAEKIKYDGVEIAENIIRDIISKDDSHFNLFWVPHINDDTQNTFPERYEIQLIFFLRDCLLCSNVDLLKRKIEFFIQDQHPIFRRVAVCCIDNMYDELKNIFWDIKDNPLEYPFIKHELFLFFQHHAKEFDSAEISQIINWIEYKNYIYPSLNEPTQVEKENYIYLKKKEWLMSLFESKNVSIIKLYNHYNNLNNHPLQHPGYDYWVDGFTYGKNKAEITKTICEKTNEDIVTYFSMKPIDINNFNNSSDEDNAETLKDCILDNPEKIWNNLTPFIRLDLNYQYEILRAFIEIWRNGKDINWKPIFEYIELIINIIENKSDFKGNESAYCDWVISAIAELIEEGTRADNHSFSPELLPMSKNILLSLESRTIPNKYYAIDQSIAILNSVRGKIYTAIINYCLRYARLFKPDVENRFDPDILELFNKRLLEKNQEEYFYSLGQYIPNILFIDKEWVYKNINIIFSKESDNLWYLAMSAYLLNNSQIYQDIYNKLKENNHLLRALDTDFNDRHINSRIIQEICVAYLNKWENLTDIDSLMKIVLSKGNVDQLKEVIHFVWTQSEYIIEKALYEDINELLSVIYLRIKDIEDKISQNLLLSALTSWIVFMREFDSKNYKIFKDIATHSSVDYNSNEMVEGLSKIVDNSPKEVADIMINLIGNDEKYPYYKEHEVIKILDRLKQLNYEDKIIHICNMLIKKGLYNYKEILKKYIME